MAMVVSAVAVTVHAKREILYRVNLFPPPSLFLVCRAMCVAPSTYLHRRASPGKPFEEGRGVLQRPGREGRQAKRHATAAIRLPQRLCNRHEKHSHPEVSCCRAFRTCTHRPCLILPTCIHSHGPGRRARWCRGLGGQGGEPGQRQGRREEEAAAAETVIHHTALEARAEGRVQRPGHTQAGVVSAWNCALVLNGPSLPPYLPWKGGTGTPRAMTRKSSWHRRRPRDDSSSA